MCLEESRYLTAYRGSFRGALRWEQLDRLWAALRRCAGAGWYIYAVGEKPPSEPVSADRVAAFIGDIDSLLRREHAEEYCGIVYADDFANPTFIKIFDPHHLGKVCGFSERPPLPGWVLSRLPPVDLPSAFPPGGVRLRWWQRFFPESAA
jgi:hypothetical protein